MKLLKISLGLLAFLSFSTIYAIDAPQNVKLDKATDSSLEISWDKVKDAAGYTVSYGTKSASGANQEYENEDAEVIGETKVKLDSLEKNTNYYIAIKSFDDNNNFSQKSNEVKFKTLSKEKSVSKQLKLGTIDIVDTRNIILNFNLPLKKDSTFEMTLVNSDDNTEVLQSDKYEIDNNQVKIFLDKDFKLNNKYNLTILDIQGKNGEIISNGVDGIKEFEVPENTKIYSEEQGKDLNSASPEPKQELTKKVLGGKDLEQQVKTTESTAKQKKKLPQTGPAETALFLLFSLLASGLFLILRRKTNS